MASTSSQQIQALLEPPDVEEANRRAVLFLNSKFQSVDDLKGLELEVSEAQKRSDALKSKLSQSETEIHALINDTRVSASSHLESAQELSLLRHSLADELSYLSGALLSSMSNGDGSSTLLEDIETLHRSLKELQSVKAYVQIIEHALKLSENAVAQVRRANTSQLIAPDSLSDYQSLRDFAAKVTETCSTVEDGAGKQTLHLVDFLQRIRNKTWLDIKNSLSTPLLAAAEKFHWPMPVDYSAAAPEDRSTFERSFLNLLQLQTIGEKIHEEQPRSEKDGLYPLQALVQPVALRFKYHFEGNRQTNRLDKPEWYFTHVLNVAYEHRSFMESIIQTLLSATKFKEINAWHEFTLLLLPLLSRKLRRTVPSLLPHPSALAHTIYQALSFDASLKEEGFTLSSTSAAKPDTDNNWEGVSEIILGQKAWFDAWMAGEKKFAEDQYHDIISASDAWQIADDEETPDEDSRVSRDLKSTNSARRIKALVEQVTDRYSPLPNFTQRTRFLISVQLPLLEQYHGRISSSLDAFETLSSALVRAVPGALGVSLGGKEDGSVNVDTRKLTSGVEGVQRLCKAMLSTRYIVAAMEGWGEELFFLELWTEINQRSSLRARAQENPLLPDPQTKSSANPKDTIFEELVVHYRGLAGRAEDIIVQQVCAEIEGNLKAHFSASTSPNPNNGLTTEDQLAISQTLLPPIALLSTHLSYLRATLAQTSVTMLYRRIALRLAEHILQRQILYRGNVTLQEGKTILAECELWVETCQAALGGAIGGGRNRVEAPWLKLLEAGRLIGAEGQTWDTAVEITFGVKNEEEWETSMVDLIGFSEISREEVGRLLRRRHN